MDVALEVDSVAGELPLVAFGEYDLGIGRGFEGDDVPRRSDMTEDSSLILELIICSKVILYYRSGGKCISYGIVQSPSQWCIMPHSCVTSGKRDSVVGS